MPMALGMSSSLSNGRTGNLSNRLDRSGRTNAASTQALLCKVVNDALRDRFCAWADDVTQGSCRTLHA